MRESWRSEVPSSSVGLTYREDCVAEALQRLNWEESDLMERKKCGSENLAIAIRVTQETSLTIEFQFPFKMSQIRWSGGPLALLLACYSPLRGCALIGTLH